jgi:hypothetical protein
VEKWINGDQINQKTIIPFLETPHITTAHIIQSLESRYAQHMGNHKSIHFGPAYTKTLIINYVTKMTNTYGHIHYPYVTEKSSKVLE